MKTSWKKNIIPVKIKTPFILRAQNFLENWFKHFIIVFTYGVIVFGFTMLALYGR